MDGEAPAATAPAEEIWALVEIFGHRRHFGRVTEVEKFGTKMLRIDVPAAAAAPLLGEAESFETFFYGGGSIFGMTPMTEEACRKAAERDRPRPYTPIARLPGPDFDDDSPDFGDEDG